MIVPPVSVGIAVLLLWAETGAVPATPLRIDCAALDRESRGALEARARAEITLRPQPTGMATVACSDHSAVVQWLASGTRAIRRQTVSLDGDPALSVDRLLDTLHALRFSSNDATPPPAALPSDSVPAPALVAAGAGDRAADRSRRFSRFGVIVEARAELWRGSTIGGVDGGVGLRLSTRAGWSLTAAGGLGRGLEPAQGIDVSTLRASLEVSRLLSARLELGLGGEWRRLTAAQGSPLGTQEQHGDTFGAFTTLRYVLAQRPFSVGVGPDLIVLAAPIAIDVGGSEAARVPRLVAGLSVAGTADLVR